MKAILILGAAVWPDGPSPTLARRTAHGATLWHEAPDATVLPCGGQGLHGPPEAVVMRDLLIQAGVPEGRIQIEDQSTNTLDNLRLALPILQRLGVTQTIIVTDKTHAPRAALVARHFRLNATFSSPPLQRSAARAHLRQSLREAAALPVYLLRLMRHPRP